jgi:hypothetical protein
VVQLDRRVQPRSVHPGTVSLHSGVMHIRSTLRVDPLTSQVWLDVDDVHALAPSTAYELRATGLVDLDGSMQSDPYSAVFFTGDALGAVPADELGQAEPVLAMLYERCGQAKCHGGTTPVAGLDLSSARGIADTAVGALPSRALGTVGEEGAAGTFWLEGLRIIDVAGEHGDPATSYLIYKVLGDGHVAGERMPLGAAPLSDSELEQLAAWIRRGAPLE